MLNLHPPTAGTLAQLVEQRTENPCVPGSIPGGTTAKAPKFLRGFFVGQCLSIILVTFSFMFFCNLEGKRNLLYLNKITLSH